MKNCLPQIAALALLLCASACKSEASYGKHRETLGAGWNALETGDARLAAERMETLLVETNAEKGVYADQRFYAAYVLARAHVIAAFGGEPFLFEQRPRAFALDASDSKVKQIPSPIAHLVAATYHSTVASALQKDAVGASAEKRAQELPEGLVTVQPQEARLFLGLSLLAIDTRLDFEDRAGQLIEDLELDSQRDVTACDTRLASARVPDGMRPWVYLALFEFHKKGDEQLAYKYAIKSLEAGHRVARSLEVEREREVKDWITEGSRYVFQCPRCPNHPAATPDVFLCGGCNLPIIDFEGVERPKVAGSPSPP